MSQLINIEIDDEQLTELKKASVNEGVDFLVEAQRIFDRGLQATTALLKEEEVVHPSSKNPRIAEFEANGAKANAEKFRAIVASNAFRERFAKEISKPKM